MSTTIRTIRTLLRLAKRSKSSSPEKPQLENLHIEMCENEGTTELVGLENIGIITSLICKNKKITYGIQLDWKTPKPAVQYARMVSLVLVSWIKVLFEQAEKEDSWTFRENTRLHVENDTYSNGFRSEMTVSRIDKTNRMSPFMSIVIRERDQPKSLITSRELYCLFAMAAKQSMALHSGPITVRLAIVYSGWVQIVTAKTTSAYMTSFLEGKDNLIDNFEIHQSPWFHFLDPSGQSHLLLSIFETFKLGPNKADKPVQHEKYSPDKTINPLWFQIPPTPSVDPLWCEKFSPQNLAPMGFW